MSLLIAIILSIILLSIKTVDGVKVLDAERKADEEWGKREEFCSCYTNFKFEVEASNYIENPQNACYINQETKQAFLEMKYQKRSYNGLTHQDKLDIILANRGKISTSAAENGYNIGYKQSGKGQNKGYYLDLNAEMDQYGFMMWLQDTICKRHEDARLVVLKTNIGTPFAYAWDGSPYERQCMWEGKLKTSLHEFKPQMMTSF